MTAKLFILPICVVCLNLAYGDEINLYGDAGQAYSVEANLGHPHQKVSLYTLTK